MNDVALRIVEGTVAPTGSPEAVPDQALTDHTQRFAYAKSLTTLHETTTIFHMPNRHLECPDSGTTERHPYFNIGLGGLPCHCPTAEVFTFVPGQERSDPQIQMTRYPSHVVIARSHHFDHFLTLN